MQEIGDGTHPTALVEVGQALYVLLSASIFEANFVTLIINYGNHARLLPSRTGIRQDL